MGSFSHNYAKDCYNYARRFHHVLLNGEASPLLHLPDRTRGVVMAALSNLSKFLGIYEEWKAIVKAYGLKWGNGGSCKLLISRINRVRNGDDILSWIKHVRASIPKLSLLLNFMLVTGLRLREALASYNLIIKLAGEGRLNEYYNENTCALEHFRFEHLFIRRSKKCFVSIIPKEIVMEIAGRGEPLTFHQIDNWVRRDNGIKSRFSDIREYWANYMLKWLNPAEIDFLQGRIGASVFMKNYFNPALIGDLRDRVLQAQKTLMEQTAP